MRCAAVNTIGQLSGTPFGALDDASAGLTCVCIAGLPRDELPLLLIFRIQDDISDVRVVISLLLRLNLRDRQLTHRQSQCREIHRDRETHKLQRAQRPRGTPHTHIVTKGLTQAHRHRQTYTQKQAETHKQTVRQPDTQESWLGPAFSLRSPRLKEKWDKRTHQAHTEIAHC